MRVEIEMAVLPPRVSAEYEINREEIRAVGRNIAIIFGGVIVAKVLRALLMRVGESRE